VPSPSLSRESLRAPESEATVAARSESTGAPDGQPDGLVAIISARAHEKWVLNGCPSGTALRDWLEAEAEVNLAPELAAELVDTNSQLKAALGESRRREEDLARAEARYRSIFDNAIEGIFQTTREGRFLTANPALARMLGYSSPEELIASVQNIGEQLHTSPERRREFQYLLEKRGVVQDFECQVQRTDGGTIWISLSARAVRDTQGNLLYFEGMVEDITERKKAEEALKDSEALYHSLVETLPICIFRKDLEGRFTFANQAFCSTLKRPLSYILGKTDLAFYPGELAHKYIYDDRRVMEMREVLEAIEEHQKPEGERTYVRVLKAPTYDSRGEVIGMQGIFWDITARMRAESELARTEVEFRVARRIQQKLFPSTIPKVPGMEIGVATYGFDIGGASFPAEAIGGDYYDFIALGDGSLGIAIGDVSGHGVGPALLMAEARALLRAFAQTHSDVSEILALINRVLVPDVDGDRFITLYLAKLDPRSRTIVYASAGHQTAFLIDSSGALKKSMPSTGIPLGIREDVDFPASPPIPMQSGDLVLLVTDGVVEARAPDGTVFGSKRAVDLVRVYRKLTARRIVDNLYHAVRAFSRDLPQYDDITATVIKVQTDYDPRGHPPPPDAADVLPV
jgi:PAS domain S-box-containing protein